MSDLKHPDIREFIRMDDMVHDFERSAELLTSGTPPDCAEHKLGLALEAGLSQYRRDIASES